MILTFTTKLPFPMTAQNTTDGRGKETRKTQFRKNLKIFYIKMKKHLLMAYCAVTEESAVGQSYEFCNDKKLTKSKFQYA